MSTNFADEFETEQPNLLDRISDWMNPILVKESRQALKSRQFVVTFMLLLLVAWGISTFGMAINYNRLEFAPLSAWFFRAFYFCLTVATYVIVPFGAYRSLLSEQEQETYEVLSITSLSPRQIVWGKLLNALGQVFIFYAAVSPFIAFSALLQGFDFLRVSYLLIVAIIVSMMASMTTLMLSTISRQKHWQALVVLSVFGMLSGLFMFSVGMTWAFTEEQWPLEEEFWWASVFMLIALVTYFFLFQQITIAQMTFESGNKSSGIRVIATIQLLLFWGSIFTGCMYFGATSIDFEPMFVALNASAIHIAVFGLFAVGESDFLSRRIRRGIPQNGLLRLLFLSYLPGGARGFLYTILQLAILCMTPLLFESMFGVDDFDKLYLLTLIISGYIIFFLGIGCWTSRAMFKMASDVKPAHGRVITGLYVAAGCIAPLLIRVVENFLYEQSRFNSWSYKFYDTASPILALMEIESRGVNSSAAGTICVLVGLGAVIAVLINTRAIFSSVNEIINAKPVRAKAQVDENFAAAPYTESSSPTPATPET